MPPLTSYSQANEALSQLAGSALDAAQWEFLTANHLLPRFTQDGETLVLTDDLMEVEAALKYIVEHTNAPDRLFPNMPASVILGPGLQIDLGADHSQIPPSFFSAARNLWRASSLPSQDESPGSLVTSGYIGFTRVSSTSWRLLQLAAAQVSRQEKLNRSRSGQFANSAHYMGSKKALSGFLVEALSTIVAPGEGLFDLMCGSGASAGAFSHFWPTIASDAQNFCRYLAVVQGGGFTAARAQDLLQLIADDVHTNVEQLQGRVGGLLETEDSILHGDFTASTVTRYQDFYRALPLYPDGRSYKSWNPTQEVADRQLYPKQRPYCLATSYFANVYVGLRQAVEIDSLRYAIDQISDDVDRAWALGALITTVSSVALTYAGHFAQPVIGRPEDITEMRLPRIVEQRAISVLHEFSIRLLSLAEESQRATYPVEVVPGPWKNALNTVNSQHHGRLTVYLDAPYTRDEYSRYYHVLETVTQNCYPSSVGPARIPSKALGERFRSEFFTRKTEQLQQAYVEIICSVLERNWRCAWSYSDGGSVNPSYVIAEVARRREIRLASFSTPYVYKAQGGRQAKSVTECLVIFQGR
jgi:adenine-specific DNA methylase